MIYEVTDNNGFSETYEGTKELFKALDDKSNRWSDGYGSTVSCNNDDLFHTDDYEGFKAKAQYDYDDQRDIPARSRTAKEQPSIKKVIAFKELDEERGHFGF